MATEFFATDSFGERIVIQRNSNDANVVINSGVLIGSSNTDAIVLTASFHDVLLRGTVSGYGNAIRFGDNAGLDERNTLRVAADGLVQAEVVGVSFQGAGQVINDGTVMGGDYGLLFNLLGNNYSAIVTNRGTISGGKEGIWITGTGNTVSKLTNYGTIEGGGLAIRCEGGNDVLVNRGVLGGSVSLGEGRDRYDGRGGVFEGINIHLGGGDDTAQPGMSAENIHGSSGFDTLDFRTSAGLRVVLSAEGGTGAAAGDIYWSFEKVLGSLWGNSTLIGDGAANQLESFAGDDTLQGRAGNDLLTGGEGTDRLSGGAGNDVFQLRQPEEGGDVVTDWGATSGNDDSLRIQAGTFGVTHVAGDMAAAHFRVRADNLAQDGDDRFVFRTTDATLWWDKDGKGGAAAELMLDLQAGAVITLADFDVL